MALYRYSGGLLRAAGGGLAMAASCCCDQLDVCQCARWAGRDLAFTIANETGDCACLVDAGTAVWVQTGPDIDDGHWEISIGCNPDKCLFTLSCENLGGIAPEEVALKFQLTTSGSCGTITPTNYEVTNEECDTEVVTFHVVAAASLGCTGEFDILIPLNQ